MAADTVEPLSLIGMPQKNTGAPQVPESNGTLLVRDIPLDEGPAFGYQRDNRLRLSADFFVRHTPKMNAISRIANIFTALALLIVSVVVVVRQGLGAS
jgi:hypothetical protein